MMQADDAKQDEPYIDIVFAGGPFPEPLQLIEVQDESRRSIKVGTMLRRDDGYWVLRIPRETAAEDLSSAGPRARVHATGNYSHPQRLSHTCIQRIWSKLRLGC